MPKIIENLREQIVAEARKQLFSQGYAGTTIRSVASACGIGVGTVYNYFPSKDLLISSFMLEDWHECMNAIQNLSPDEFDSFFTGISNALQEFKCKYDFLFSDKDAYATYASAFSDRHRQLCEMIAKIIGPAIKKTSDNTGFTDDEFLKNYIAESILIWVMSDSDIKDQLTVLHKLLNQ